MPFGKGLFLIWFIVLAHIVVEQCLACSKVPVFNGRPVTKEKKAGDNGYRLAVRNDPSGYEPGKIYNCTVKYCVFYLLLLPKPSSDTRSGRNS